MAGAEQLRPTPPPLRVGVVGLGYAGRTHTECFNRVPGVRVVALAGLEADELRRLGDLHAVPHRHADWKELIARDDLDVVSVCTPNHLHAPIAIAALENGCHVLCEKPLARTAAEAAAMVRAAEVAELVLETAFNHRQRSDVLLLKRYVDEGLLGRIYHVKASWMRRRGIPGRGSWFTNKALAGGGPLIDLGVHVLDQALFLMGEPEIATVSAATYAELGPRGKGFPDHAATGGPGSRHLTDRPFDIEDLASAFLRTADGRTLLLEASWAVHGPFGDDYGLDLYGSAGGARIEVKDYGWADTLRVFTDIAGAPTDLRPTLAPVREHQAVIDAFVATIRGDDWSSHVGREGLQRARIIDACYASASDGHEVVLARNAPAAPVETAADA